MVFNYPTRRRIGTAVAILVLFRLAAGLNAEEITLLTPNESSAAANVLSFPADH